MPRQLLTMTFSALLTIASAGARAEDCKEIAGSAPLLVAGRTVLVGEVHGTREMPAALLRMACSALRRGVPVAVGLEINDTGGALAAYLATADEAAASKAYLAHPFWVRGQDGRASAAMFDTIRAFKALQRQGLPLSVFALYDSAALSDQKMAEQLRRERVARPQALIITFTGNIHNMLGRAEWMPAGVPATMGALVADLQPVSIGLENTGGSSWSCIDMTCGVHAWMAPPDGGRAQMTVLPARQPVYSVEINVGPTTASPPAVGASVD